MGKYLGLPKHFGRKKKDLFSSIVDRMQQKALSWSTCFLSMAGKAVMLQSVLSAIPNFAMSAFELPVSLCKRIQSVLTRFWWEKKVCWVSWDTLTLPKGMGGLGFRDIQAFNRALLGKISWRIITKPDCLLARILVGKYCSNSSFLTIHAATSSSHGWKGILRGRDVLLNHLGKEIGDGEATSVWKDSWIKPDTKMKPYGPVLAQDQDLLVSDLLSRETKEWNKIKIDKLLPEPSSHILSIYPSKLGARDSYFWGFHSSGTYTAKTGYLSLQTTKLQSTAELLEQDTEGWSWTKYVWSPNLLPKLKMFLWKLSQCSTNL